MREIKFRGKSLDNGEWVYGDLHIRTPFPHIHSEIDYGKVDIDPHTVGQFTGLHDKYGAEIYEGDIIIEKLRRARKEGERLVICFDDFEYKGKNANGATTSLSLLAEYHTIEVIGNIHDNPELLNK